MIRTMTLAALLMLVALPASAQRGMMNPLRQLPLTQSDFSMIRTTVDRLTEEQRVGESAEWSNPESGNGGTVTLVELFEENGYDCRRVRHVIRIERQADPKELLFKSCRDTDGVWKLA